jgi:HEPN domain-containing protein
MKAETAKWWAKSQRDLETAEILLENERLAEGAFFLQQSIEKALKSLLIERRDDFPRIHDLVSLGKQAAIPNEFLEICKRISPAYVYSRYPDVTEISGLEEKIEDFVIQTREVLRWIEGRM